jgi:hypothetical protein
VQYDLSGTFSNMKKSMVRTFYFFLFSDSYQQYDGYIYAKKNGFVVNFFKDTLGLANSSMIETMKNDGQYALKQYLPDIKHAIEMPIQEPTDFLATMNEYHQVLQGGIQDHFMKYRSRRDPQILKEVALCIEIQCRIEVRTESKLLL